MRPGVLWEYQMGIVKITYFSDMLCVWAYISQARMNAISEKFGDSVRIEHRFCSVFGDTAQKISSDVERTKADIGGSTRICDKRQKNSLTLSFTLRSG